VRFAFLLLVTVCSADIGLAQAADAQRLSGTYYGYESMPNLSPDEPEAYWYYEVTLVVTGTKVRMSKSPRIKLKGAITASSSDGGFPVSEGEIRTLAGRTVIALHQVSCDYCGERMNDPLPPDSEREYIVLFASNGMFELDRIRFDRKPNRALSLKPGT
jgi:hypothetical protein